MSRSLKLAKPVDLGVRVAQLVKQRAERRAAVEITRRLGNGRLA